MHVSVHMRPGTCMYLLGKHLRGTILHAPPCPPIRRAGLCKASANLALGWWVSSPADVKWGGLAGWVLALMVPLLAALAKNWATVVLANAVLGFQQVCA